MIREELERRLKKIDLKRLPSVLAIEESYDDIVAVADLHKLLIIADKNGSKYIQFYKLKDDVDIRTLTSNLDIAAYQPNLDRLTNGNSIKISHLTKGDDSFSISSDFYSNTQEWILTETGVKYLQDIYLRRTINLEKTSGSNYMILSIDPIGEGALIGRDIPEYLSEISNLLGIDIMNFFDIQYIAASLHQLVSDNDLVVKNAKSRDEQTGRTREVIATSPRDDISTEDIYQGITEGQTSPQKMKYKFEKETVELFDRTLMKIGTKIDWSNCDELKRKIISVL